MDEKHGPLAQETLVPPHDAGMIESPVGRHRVLLASVGVGEPLVHDRLGDFVGDAAYAVYSTEAVEVAVGGGGDAEEGGGISEGRSLLRDRVGGIVFVSMV